MQTCATCKKAQPLEAFGIARKETGGRNYNCKACVRAYGKVHYRKNKASYLEKARRWEARMRETIQAAKSKPCADCGGLFHFSAMDFDHLPGEEKSFTVSAGHKISMKRVAAEIAKCEVVCSNCHRVRTYHRLKAA